MKDIRLRIHFTSFVVSTLLSFHTYAQQFCAEMFSQNETSPHIAVDKRVSSKIILNNPENINATELNKYAESVERITNLLLPPEITIKDARTMFGSATSRSILDYKIELEVTPRLYASFVHEYSHTIVLYNLSARIPQLNEWLLKQKRYFYLQERSLSSSKTEFLSESTEYSRLSEELSYTDNLRALSSYFEEIFCDLTATVIFKNPKIFDDDGLGFRNFEAELGQEPRLYWDPHVAFHSFGKYIYKTYLQNDTYKKSVVFDSFYELIESETVRFIKSTYVHTKGPLVTKVNGTTSINGVILKNYLEEMQKKLDIIISQKN